MVKKNLSEYNQSTIPKLKKARIGIVVSEWNDTITKNLLTGAVDTLQKNGIDKTSILIEWVPGSFELPIGAQFFARYSKVDAVICLGCIIKGETKHNEYIASAVAHSLAQVALNFNMPVIFGVLTTDNYEQAAERSGGKRGNKGVEAAITAIKMIAMKEKLKDY